MKIQMVAETRDPEFFRKTINEMGSIAYTMDEQGNVKEAIYFSGSRLIRLTGKIAEETAKIIKAEGYPFKEIDIDLSNGILLLK